MEIEHNDLRKALLSTAGDGANLIPEVVSAGLRQFVIDNSPLYNLIDRISWPTNLYMYRQVDELTTATFQTDGGALPDADAGGYDTPTAAMKYVYARGDVTGPMQAASRTLLDAMATEIDIHIRGLIRKLEQTIITGNASTNAKEFDGLLRQITNTLDATAGSSPLLTLSMIDEALDLSHTYPNVGVMNRASGRRIWALLQAQQRFVDSTVVGAGFRVPSYNDVQLIRVDNSITGLGGTLAFFDRQWVRLPYNQDITFEPLAKTKDSDDFMIKMYVTLAVEGASLYHSKITGATLAP